MLFKKYVDLSATNENRLQVVLSNNIIIYSDPYDKSKYFIDTDFS